MGNPTNSLQSVTRPRSVRQPSRQSKSRAISVPRLLLIFAQRHPFLCLFATWGAFLYFGWIAANGLAYTNPAPLETPKPQVSEAPKPAFRIDTPATSFGLLAIVAASCAATSVLLAKQLRPLKSNPKPATKRVVIQAKPVPSRSSRSTPPTATRRPPMPISPTNMPEPQTRRAAATAKPPTPKPVTPTVLSVEEDGLFERDPSLADMLDIRQRRL